MSGLFFLDMLEKQPNSIDYRLNSGLGFVDEM